MPKKTSEALLKGCKMLSKHFFALCNLAKCKKDLRHLFEGVQKAF